MKRQLAMTTLFAVILMTVAAADQWDIDKAHSYIGFSAQHMVVSHVPGKFENYDGKVIFDGKNLAAGSTELTINVQSINTGNERRDNHLRSSEFFDLENFPIITFKSSKIVPGEGNKFKMLGDLTIRGITKPITLDCFFNGTITDTQGNTRAGFAAGGSIKRHDFNIAWDNKLQDGSFIVGEEITLDIQAELVKQVNKE